MNILAIDIGGTHIKFRTQRSPSIIKVKSGRSMTPRRMMKELAENLDGIHYDHVSIGYPGPVVNNHPVKEPFNLGKGWRTFSFARAFEGKPVRMLNDAALQALGSYRGGRMLFLGLGTGLGSAMVVNGIVQGLELAHLPWKKGKTYEDFLGLRGLEHNGEHKWSTHVFDAVSDLKAALLCDTVVIGGGNGKLLKKLPDGVMLGSNENAFKGGFLLWKKKHQHSS